MLIRPAVTADAAELAALHLRVWDEAYTGLIDQALLDARHARAADVRTAAWVERLRTPTVVAVQGDRIVGFATAGAGRDLGAGLPATELMSIYVVAELYSAGVGHALLEAAIGDAPAYLWVLAGNLRAARFYRRHGFEYDGATRSDAYGTEHRMRRGAASHIQRYG